MIIHGKNVEIVTFAPKHIKLSRLPLYANIAKNIAKYRILREISTPFKRRRLHYLDDVIKSFLKGDLNQSFSLMMRSIEEQFVSVLQRRPEFITSDNFNVYINYFIDDQDISIFGYNPPLSSPSKAYFRVNLAQILILIINKNPEPIEGHIIYGLENHMIRAHHIKGNLLAEKLLDLSKSPSAKLPSSYYFIFILFTKIKDEGIIDFRSQLESAGKVDLLTNLLSSLIGILQSVATTLPYDYVYNKDDYQMVLQIQYQRLYRTGAVHDVGVLMVSIIVLHKLFERDIKFAVWIRKKVYGIYKKDYNAKNIGNFFGKSQFELVFTDREIFSYIFEITDYLAKIDVNQFLKEYEEACIYFNLKNTFFNSDSFHYYATLCIYNYKKTVLGIDDPKIKRQVERFKR